MSFLREAFRGCGADLRDLPSPVPRGRSEDGPVGTAVWGLGSRVSASLKCAPFKRSRQIAFSHAISGIEYMNRPPDYATFPSVKAAAAIAPRVRQRLGKPPSIS